MKKQGKKWISVCLVAILLLSFVGCSSNDDGNSNGSGTTGSGSNGTESTSGSGGSGGSSSSDTIEFWSVFTGPDGDNMTAMVDAYNATSPDMEVIHRPIEAGELYTRIPTMAQTGTDIPDLTIMHVERVAQFVENEMLMPLDSYIAANGNIKAEDYVPSAWDGGHVNNNQYAIPLDVHSFITYYNKDLLEKYGPNVLDDGAITFDEVKAVSAAAKEDGIFGMGITWMRVKALAWYAQLGGKLSEDGEVPSFNNEAFEKVLNTVAELHDLGLTSEDGDDPGQLFQSGQMVFWPEGIWMRNNLDRIETLNYGMAQFIQFDPNIQGNWTSSHQMVMIKNPNMTDERAAGIMAFIEWVGENSIEWARAGQNPASLKILDNAEYLEMGQSFLLEATDSLVISDYKHYGYAVEALDKIVWEVPFGRMTAEEGLAQAEKETADRIAAGE